MSSLNAIRFVRPVQRAYISLIDCNFGRSQTTNDAIANACRQDFWHVIIIFLQGFVDSENSCVCGLCRLEKKLKKKNI